MTKEDDDNNETEKVKYNEGIRYNHHSILTIVFYQREQLISSVLFDAQSNNLWDIKHRALQKFTHAARMIIVRNRCQRKLDKLREFMKADHGEKKQDKDAAASIGLSKWSTLGLKPSVFPLYQFKTQENTQVTNKT